jgi:hypothetical protein
MVAEIAAQLSADEKEELLERLSHFRLRSVSYALRWAPVPYPYQNLVRWTSRLDDMAVFSVWPAAMPWERPWSFVRAALFLP